MKKLDADFHIHTVYSGHSDPGMTVESVVRRAEALGLKSIAITEHSFEWNLGPAGNAKLIKKDLAEAKPKIDVFVGMEICPDPKTPGKLIYEDFEKGDLYPVLTGFHSYAALGCDGGWNEQLRLDAAGKRRMRVRWLETMALLAANPLVDIFAHPGRILSQNGILEEFDNGFLRGLDDVFDAAKAHGVAVELNENAFQRFPTERLRESYLDVFRLALSKGLKVSLGSDAHKPEDIGRFDILPGVMRKIGLRRSDCWTPKKMR